MNVLFLTLIDIVDLNERGIYQDLLLEFMKNGHCVTIVSPSERRKQEKTRVIEGDQYRILKIKTGNIQKTNMIEKGISTVLMETQFKNAIKKYLSAGSYDLILYSTPPITLVRVIKYLKKKQQGISYLLLKDIFPQNAIDLKLLPLKGFILDYFKNKEKKLYLHSDFIGCMSPANKSYLLEHNPYLSGNTIEVCPNTITVKKPLSYTIDKEKIAAWFGIPINKRIFVYGGNFGKPQGVPFIIECLNRNRENDQVFFVFAGAGTEYHLLEEFDKKHKEKNWVLLPQLSKTQYDLLLQICDVGLIFLDHRFTIPNFPSRLLSYMEYSLPVLACTDVHSDIGDIVCDGNFGWFCESNDPEHFAQILSSISQHDIEVKGKNARQYLETHYTSEISYQTIMRHFI